LLFAQRKLRGFCVAQRSFLDERKLLLVMP